MSKLTPMPQGGIYPIIMAGGSGTRFWPLSRQNRPKQFLNIGGGQTLLEETMQRLDPLAPWSDRYIVAGERHQEAIHALCPLLPPQQLLIEPCARNTAPCVALAALHIALRDPQGVMIVLPADHHIAHPENFRTALRSSIEGARNGKILTLGVIPTRPETGYGYLRFPGGGQSNETRLPVERFVEKPPRQIAEEYVNSGSYLWNSGVFIFGVQRILQEFTTQLPEMSAALEPVTSALMANDQDAYHQALTQAFFKISAVSIDVGIMEGADDVEVVPLSAGWSDVGHWGALDEISPIDPHGNLLIGHQDHIVVDAQHVTVHSERVTAIVGVDDIVVVNTDDATLVCHRERAQEVRQVVDQLRLAGRTDLT